MVSATFCPKQIVVKLGVMLITGTADIETVATAVEVHVPTPEITVYEVVDEGVTVTLAALAGFAPLLAVHT